MITDLHVERFQTDGFCIVEDALSAHELQLLRDECERLVDDRDAEMHRLGVRVDKLDHRGRRYFIQAWDRSAKLRQFLTSGTMPAIARSLLGAQPFLFNEQYVVKSAERGMDFSWHQDSGFIDYAHPVYLTCWIALDDVHEDNGTVYLLPYGRAGTRDVVPHRIDAKTNDRVGYSGDDPGDPVIVRAGSIACFTSTVLHRSGSNTTQQMRRIYLAQYSPEPILAADSVAPRRLAIPLSDDADAYPAHRCPRQHAYAVAGES